MITKRSLPQQQADHFSQPKGKVIHIGDCQIIKQYVRTLTIKKSDNDEVKNA